MSVVPKLYKAIAKNDLPTIKAILAQHPELVDRSRYDGFALNLRFRPLDRALATANDDIVQYLAEKVDMGAALPYEAKGQSYVEVAAEHGRDAFAKEWLTNYSGIWPAQSAVCNKTLSIAARNGNMELARWLIEQQLVDVNAANTRGISALGEAQASGNAELADYLTAVLRDQKTTAATAPAVGWSLIDSQTVAYQRSQDGAGYRLTDIFNFAQGTCVTLYRNLETDVETPVQNTFATLAGTSALAEAQAQLQRLGGDTAAPTTVIRKGL